MKTIKILATLRELTGANELNVPLEEGDTVRDLIAAVGEICPELRDKALQEDGELTGAVQIMINGRHVRWLEGLDTRIQAKDQLMMMPLIGGG